MGIHLFIEKVRQPSWLAQLFDAVVVGASSENDPPFFVKGQLDSGEVVLAIGASSIEEATAKLGRLKSEMMQMSESDFMARYRDC